MAEPNSISLLQNPLSGGTPAKASNEMTRPNAVIGIFLPSPLILSKCTIPSVVTIPAIAINAAPFITA